jgi:hypothetical protein
MHQTMSEHVAILRQAGQPIPEPSASEVTIVGIPTG